MSFIVFLAVLVTSSSVPIAGLNSTMSTAERHPEGNTSDYKSLCIFDDSVKLCRNSETTLSPLLLIHVQSLLVCHTDIASVVAAFTLNSDMKYS